ncbi:hypothetical protein BGZ76_000238, partial [Entomortierella beljakovae]
FVASNMATRAPLTHFLAIPLYTPPAASRINSSLSRFAAEARANVFLTPLKKTSSSSQSPDGLVSSLETLSLADQEKIPGESEAEPSLPSPPLLPSESLRPIPSIHLTLGVMSLCDAERLEEASSFLRSLDINALLRSAAVTADANKGRGKPKKSKRESSPTKTDPNVIDKEEQGPVDPVKVTLRGLLPMQLPAATSSLYAAPIDTTERLQIFCESLQRLFIRAGFIQPENRPLKLHATIVNTLQVKNKAMYGGGGSRGDGRMGRKQRLLIEATALIERWKDEEWAEVTLEKVAICEMGAKLASDGLIKYREIAEIPMPTTTV